MSQYTSTGLIGANLASTSTTQIFPLGMEEFGIGTNGIGATFMYVKAASAITAFDIAKIDDDFTIASLTTTISGSEPTACGAAQIAFATNEYGWVAVKGRFKVNALTLCVADVKLYTTATAGAVDDTATDLIQGLKLLTTVGGATAATEAYASTYMVTNGQD